jgi:hypothetical protein
MSVREPDRLLREDPALPADLRRAFAAYADITPTAGARDSLFAHIQRGALDIADNAGMAPRAKPGHRTLWLVVSVLGFSFLAALVWHLEHGETQVAGLALGTAVEPHAPESSPSAPGGGASVPRAANDLLDERPIVLPAPRVEPVGPAVKRARARGAPSASVAPREEAEPVDPSGELALLARAKRVLPGDGEAALNLTREHAARFPRGLFREEREVIAIEALFRVGQRERALSRARAFRQAFPRSTHLDRLAVILREP